MKKDSLELLNFIAQVVFDKKGQDDDGEWTNFDLSSVGAGDLERNALC